VTIVRWLDADAAKDYVRAAIERARHAVKP
jgi:hypothetical protein